MIYLLLVLTFRIASGLETYNERLDIKTLEKGRVHAKFTFLTSKDIIDNDFILFPRVLDQLVEKYNVHRFVLTMQQGRWRREWNEPPQPASPIGAQLLVYFKTKNATEAEKNFSSLVEAANGLFCTSLSSLTVTAVSPELPVLEKKSFELTTRYGIVSKETTCTENLSQLRKLLPCKSSGLSVFLHPSKLYDSLFHSLSVSINSSCEEIKCRRSIEFELSVVFKTPADGWLLSRLFDSQFSEKCSVAESSKVTVSHDPISDKVKPSGKELEKGVYEYDFSVWTKGADLEVETPSFKNSSIVQSAGIRIWSTLGGLSQHSGELRISVKNLGKAGNNVVISQIVPYFVRVHYNSLMVKCRSASSRVREKVFKASKAPKSSLLIQYNLEIDETDTCILHIPLEKSLLRINDYTPDANHGMYIPGAIATFLQIKNDLNGGYAVHSNAVLVALPVPDFSMPFNVICFVATTLAVCFSPIHTFSTLWISPDIPKSVMVKKIYRGCLLMLLALSLYAHFNNSNLHDLRRFISAYLQKLNELK
ncbi:unnamed protein product [Caenorhabditis auriculariae]|uniref:GPI transamidase component PIG-T n=1 Tax=Caenorhabditis auriculariae TaxID=2777116 RepID=A0A8S1GZI9_9PELO|nr:unnamed protein product [Caenorhabditis auriculariae]